MFSSSRVPKLLQLLYNHNPFYLISACLFVFGIKELCRPGQVDFLFERGSVAYIDPWFLMTSLCGVTLLMALTAYLIVKLGQVWEDMRSLVLVVLLMFLAISVSFDEIITVSAENGGGRATAFRLLSFGFFFSITVSEALMRGLKIAMPWSYRGPLYGVLALFFIAPLWVSPEFSDISDQQVRWRIAAFPLLASAMTMLLLPAVWKGASLVKENGTPWSWPWFPWPPFVFMAGAVCFRTYTLSISFDVANLNAHFWDTSFGVYLLVPFFLSVVILLFEMSVVEYLPRLQRTILLVAPLLLLAAYPWGVPWSRLYTYTAFATSFTESIGSPVFLTLVALAAFYAWVWIRGVAAGEVGCLGMLLLSSIVGPDAFVTSSWRVQPVELQASPLVVLAALELLLAFRRRSSREALIGWFALSLAIGVVLEGAAFKYVVVTHAMLVGFLVIAAIFNDKFARAMRRAGAVILGATFVIGVTTAINRDVNVFVILAWGVGIVLVSLAYALILRDMSYLITAGIQIICTLFGGMYWVWQLAPLGGRVLLVAVCSFVTGVCISSLKGGVAERLLSRRTT